ncbi:hypothetical protein MVEG_05018 [Podila verticillata NRRL 6337]|nr:hypothetical protein MVEG_05018 [Podila verticillata NRRL 6337]
MYAVLQKIQTKGAQELAEALKTITTEALKTNSTLTTLNLQDNSIGDNGAQALAEALKTKLTLTTSNL